MVLAVYAPDLAAKMFVTLDSLRPALRVCLTRAVFVVAGWRDLELATDRLDAVLVDESPEAIRVMRERMPHATVR